VPLTATANPGYHFTGWTGSADISNPASPSTTIRVNAPETITANFASNISYSLVIAPNNAAWGSVTPASGTSYTAGTVVSLTATANTGYVFTGWTGSADISNPANPNTTITMNASKNITANFAVTTAPSSPLVIALSNAACGSVTPASGTFYPAGTVVQLTATANALCTFTGWTGSSDISNPASPSTTITMNWPEGITANFAPIVPVFYQLVIAPNDPTMGWAFPASGTYYAAGTVVTLTAIQYPGYYFTGWTAVRT
jgi:uncharacterized repeat protein (TIGR02543 family)